NPYASGAFNTSINSGSTWTTNATDLYFQDYVTPTVLQTAGNFVSSVKDSGTLAGSTPSWSTLSWTNGAVPAGATLTFQVAGSSSSSGPFKFVGLDGYAAQFCTPSGPRLLD